MNKPIHERYGGVSDAPHLGGWSLQIDIGGISNNTFNFMMGILGIKSILDIGCGRGISTRYFHDRGADVLCVEGSHEAVTRSELPASRIVEHDYTLGPWWPARSFDACWSVEFLEHVSRQYTGNYMPSFHKCALIFATRSRWSGHHHHEVHPEWWWVTRFRMRGFVFDRELTDVVRRQATVDQQAEYRRTGNQTQLGQHLRLTMMVFVNPSVAALPAHDHLMGGYGCYNGVYDNVDGGRPCLNDTLPPAYSPLMHCTKPKGGNDVDDRSALWQCH
jgi:SAM-dependent methyltransferase